MDITHPIYLKYVFVEYLKKQYPDIMEKHAPQGAHQKQLLAIKPIAVFINIYRYINISLYNPKSA